MSGGGISHVFPGNRKPRGTASGCLPCPTAPTIWMLCRAPRPSIGTAWAGTRREPSLSGECALPSPLVLPQSISSPEKGSALTLCSPKSRLLLHEIVFPGLPGHQSLAFSGSAFVLFLYPHFLSTWSRVPGGAILGPFLMVSGAIHMTPAVLVWLLEQTATNWMV